MKPIYTTRATATGGRAGTAKTDDGLLEVTLVRPKELGGTGKGGTNPEQLFACGYAACFTSTIEHIARMKKVEIGEISTSSEVVLGRNDSDKLGLAIKLEVTIPGVDTAVAQELVDEAHVTCPYSTAIAGNVAVDITVA